MSQHNKFEGQNDNETLIIFTRRHWFVLFGVTLGIFFAAFIPILFIFILAPFIIAVENGATLFLFCWLVYNMCLWLSLAYTYTIYALDTWIVTDSRILDIVQIGLFNRKISELHLDSIQDISVNTKGIIQSYLNFGNIEIQTAGSAQRFMFDRVPNPLAIKDAIMDAARAHDEKMKRGV